MQRLLLTPVLLVSLSLAALAHTMEPAGAPPSEAPAAVSGMVQKDGVRVLDGKKVVSEIWFRTAAPSGAKSSEEAVTLPNFPVGAFLGIIRLPEPARTGVVRPSSPGSTPCVTAITLRTVTTRAWNPNATFLFSPL